MSSEQAARPATASIAAHIKEIGRGAKNSRDISREAAYDLFSKVLDREVTDLEIGAFCLAMRIKGESVDELAAFLDAAHERCWRIPALKPTVVIASYNGARKLPNLVALLALLLARHNVAVLVHGVTADAGRVTTAQVFDALGLPWADSPNDVLDAWATEMPAFVPIESLSPELARLLLVRRTVGVRNSAHSIVKMLKPIDTPNHARVAEGHPPVLRLVNYTHPEYLQSLGRLFEQEKISAILARGTEGEAVADPRKHGRMDLYHAGVCTMLQAAPDAPAGPAPVLPAMDETSTGRYIEAVLAGQIPVPAPIAAQVEHILRALQMMRT
ncbi:MAG: DNA-binding protein YbiB [Pseudomonadota bacterium]|jgi:anthranilate phosphoribosyltransferase